MTSEQRPSFPHPGLPEIPWRTRVTEADLADIATVIFDDGTLIEGIITHGELDKIITEYEEGCKDVGLDPRSHPNVNDALHFYYKPVIILSNVETYVRHRTTFPGAITPTEGALAELSREEIEEIVRLN